MELALILNGKATLEDLLDLYRIGFEFGVNNGAINEIIRPGE